ncbi:MAG: hypothetical protein ACLFVF_04135 [Thiohalospira sp.]
MTSNPFETERNPFTGEPMGATSAEDRLEMVPRFTAQECRDALALPGLQKAVANALRRRLTHIEAQEETTHDG